jgi:hypothetical protein
MMNAMTIGKITKVIPMVKMQAVNERPIFVYLLSYLWKMKNETQKSKNPSMIITMISEKKSYDLSFSCHLPK